MFKLEWKVNGRKVRPDQLGTEMMKMFESGVTKQAEQKVQEKLAHLRCDVHGETPRVTARGRELEKLQFNLHTCCDEMMDRAKALLGTTE